MAFMTALLRFFVAIGIALWIIAGGVLGWFYDALPGIAGSMDIGAAPAVVTEPAVAFRLIGAVVGCIVGLFLATVTFGVLALLLDIRDRLVVIADTTTGGRRVVVDQHIDGKPLNYDR